MPYPRLDRKGPVEPQSDGRGGLCCRWCGRPIKRRSSGRYVHRPRWSRMWPDPRTVIAGEKAMPVDLALLAAAAVQAGYPEPVAEYRFHATRKWALDLAWPGLLVGLEREGYARGGGAGRHQRGEGYARDCEKYTEAAIAGWLLVRVTGRQIESGAAAGLLLRALAERVKQRGVWEGLCGRIAAQSELLSRKAERV